MSIFLLLDGSTRIVESVHQFSGKFFFHCAFAAFTGIAYSPTDTEREPAVSPHFNGNLVIGAADTAGTNFQDRHNVIERLFKYFHRIFIHFGTDNIEGIVNDGFGNAFFTVQHYFINEARNKFGMIYRIRQYIALRHGAFSGHV